MLIGVTLGLVFVMGGGGSFPGIGGGNGEPEIVCNLEGRITGLVEDLNASKDVKDYTLNLSTANCHEKGLFEFNLVNPPYAALFSEGHVDIDVNLYKGNSLEGSHRFTVTTAFGQTQKSFSEDLVFTGLEPGQYTVRVLTSWNNESGIDYYKNFTVTP